MAKKNSKTETEQVTASAPAPASASAPKEPKAPKAAKAPKEPKAATATTTAATATPTPVTVPTPTPTPTPTPVTATDSESAAVPPVLDSDVAKLSVVFLTKLQALSVAMAALKTEYRALEKTWSREIKAAQKVSSKRKRKAGNRAPSGFVKPTKISDELAGFLGKDMGSEMARTDVTREINTYIRLHKLQDPSNGRQINPDAKLAKLLKLTSEDTLTYFNLQKYMSPHFAKAVKAVVATA